MQVNQLSFVLTEFVRSAAERTHHLSFGAKLVAKNTHQSPTERSQNHDEIIIKFF
jgi:hypothetical protein